ncbi:MAG TPA: hypothetical protein VGM11_06145 [Acidobacteriaceae bacterium]|jgi:hypothetical protein
MIDVHAPPKSDHTWTDFFIHIATIAVGLLLAIGLEQTVEAIHHAHQRRALIEDMRAESERTVQILDSDLRLAGPETHWEKLAQRRLSSAEPVNGIITVTLPDPLSTGDHNSRIAPRSVLQIAKANGTIALLPEDLAEVYSRLDYEADRYMESQADRLRADNAVSAVTGRLDLSVDPGATLHLAATDRDELVRALAIEYANEQHSLRWAAIWAGAADAVVHNVHSVDAMGPFIEEQLRLVPRNEPAPAGARP